MRPVWFAVAAVAAFQVHAGIEQQLSECAAVTDERDRLACYDELAAGIAAAPALAPASDAAAGPGEQPIAQPAVVDAEVEFGVKQKKTVKEVGKIYLEVAGLDRDPYGALIITFSNGQLWKQIDRNRYKLDVGETVFIEKGALRSFLLGSDSRNSTIRVKRLR